MRDLRQRFQPHYIVGSVHDVDGLCIDFSPEATAKVADAVGGREAMQIRYFEAVADLVTKLRPEVVGHLDLIRKFDGQHPSFSPNVHKHISRALEAVAASGSMMEINVATHRRGLGPVYPLPEILREALKMGIDITLGDDSHGAHDVGVGLDAGLAAISSAGYREVCYLATQDGAVVRERAALSEIKPRQQLDA
jgi:histidinol-phosphatase (PHP family)